MTEGRQRNLTATALGQRYHRQCDLALFLSYHERQSGYGGRVATPAVVQAHFDRGLNWEARLLDELERKGELQRLDGVLGARQLFSVRGVLDRPQYALRPAQTIVEDLRDHFYLANLAFVPPLLYPSHATLRFGLAKPDLIEVTKQGNHVELHVIDAKASKAVKTSHLVQVYYYAVCLARLLGETTNVSIADHVSIWLPQDSIDRPISTSLALLAEPLDAFFARLPRLLSTPEHYVDRHFNPLCGDCPFEAKCRARARGEGTLGVIPNLAISDAALLNELTNIGHYNAGRSDIEEVDALLRDPERCRRIEAEAPTTTRRAKQLLSVDSKTGRSPVIEAARTRRPVYTGRRSLTLPRAHHLALYVSLLDDPTALASSTFAYHLSSSPPRADSGPIDSLVSTLSSLLRDVVASSSIPFHIYVWSSAELDQLQRHLITSALEQPDSADVRICIGALCDGGASLTAAFQPPVLSGALLDFLARKGQLAKPELLACLERLDVPPEERKGTVEVLRARLEKALEALRATGESSGTTNTVGYLPKVCVLANEVRQLAALPVEGYWDLPEAHAVLAPITPMSCPSAMAIYERVVIDIEAGRAMLIERTKAMAGVAEGLRALVGTEAMLNTARPSHFGIMDLCRQPVLRKLFFLQQFEVFSRLQELWRSRLEGLTEAPVLRYRELEITSDGRWLHHFDLVSGTLDLPTEGNGAAFFDQLLAPLDLHAAVPLELHFDDLAWCSSRFPLNKHQRPKWQAQGEETRRLVVAQVYEVGVDGVTLLTFGTTSPVKGAQHRLSTRLVDFNYQRILRNLLDLDLACDSATSLPPLVELLDDPTSFGSRPSFGGEELLIKEARINTTYRELANLGNADASALLLKRTQRAACRRLLSSALTVVWGPPGSGKSYTVRWSCLALRQVDGLTSAQLALSLLRLIEVADPRDCKLILVSAMTHAAIEAVKSKLIRLIAHTRAVPNLDHSWLDVVSVEHVLKGSEHPLTATDDATRTRVLCGTAFQLHSWTKRSHAQADVVLLDESGQLALVVAALVLASLSPRGKLVVAGDHEQLAPIFASAYPPGPLTGSVLDLLVSRRDVEGLEEEDEAMSSSGHQSQSSDPSRAGTVVQLSENFRLNADLSAFVELIYRRRFRPQKTQAARIADRLLSLASPSSSDPLRRFLVSLGAAMQGRGTTGLVAPTISFAGRPSTTSRPISLAMLKLSASSTPSEVFDYGVDLTDLVPGEAHVRAEAQVVASLVALLREAFGADETIFVACPHRAQRAAVGEALQGQKDDIEEHLAALSIGGDAEDTSATTVETVERLQGSEASFVIVSLSHTHLASLTTTELDFLLTRRRLNVALSRSKTLCILLTSDGVLRPSVDVLARPAAASGLAFLRDYEARAWSASLSLDLSV